MSLAHAVANVCVRQETCLTGNVDLFGDAFGRSPVARYDASARTCLEAMSGNKRQPRRKTISMLDSFKQAVAFAPQGGTVGNLSLGRGTVEGRPTFVAIVENRIASGAIGKAECDKLKSLFIVVAAQRAALVLFIDSAGARVSEGLPALGAFRQMFAAALKASVAGAQMSAVLGSNCYGGASMLAALCGRRYFNANTRLAMSGPSILAAGAGASAIDDAFRAIAEVSIGTGGRIKLDGNVSFTGTLGFAPPISAVDTHLSLGARLVEAKLFAKGASDSVQRRDFGLMYASGYQLAEQDGMLLGTGTDAKGMAVVLGSIDRRQMSAARASQLTGRLQAMLAGERPARLQLLFDCDAHSAALDDEKVMLSSYLANLAQSLWLLREAGTRIETVVLSKLGGGIYVALAAASHEVNVIYGGEIQLLPSKAMAAILGDSPASKVEFADYVAAGVAERELRIGMV